MPHSLLTPLRFARHAGIISLALLAVTSLHAQSNNAQPTHRDVAYDDDDPAQVLDVYLVDSDTPVPAMVYIHGGGWRAGSKDRIPGWLKQLHNEQKCAVVSVEYRFTDVATHPAQVNDSLRAIQLVRHRAKQWNIDPQAIGVTGGSAGGHLSLYVALHDDVADAESSDPVKRHSSRVACAVDFAGPTDWSLLSEREHRHPAYRQLLGYEPGTPADEMDAASMKSVSPISYVSQDDPPIMIVHGKDDEVVPIIHAERMRNALKQANVTVEMVVIDQAGHEVAGAGPQVTQKATAFVERHLLHSKQ